jgi:beta-N-acetylhexosaminidase
VPILIDQEGGRVARMRPPEWPAFPRGEAFDQLYQLAPSSAIEAARVNARALALMLREVGVNVDCLPMLDVRQPGATDIIGDRALGSEPMQVAALGRACSTAGLGRRRRRDQAYAGPRPRAGRQPQGAAGRHRQRGGAGVDLEPFERLRDAPMGMTAHVVYTAWDAERPASLSPIVIGDIIRERIGFDGFLMSDDIGMEALPAISAARRRRASPRAATSRCIARARWRKWSRSRRGPAMSAEGEARLARAMAMHARRRRKWISPRRRQARRAAGAGVVICDNVAAPSHRLRMRGVDETNSVHCAGPRDDEELNLSLDGWEGPLDLLLNLARAQKVDLARRSRSSRWSSNISPISPRRGR